MAGEIGFQYNPIRGPLHRVHPLIKLAFLGIISLGSLGAEFPGLTVISLGIVVLSFIGAVDPRTLFRGARTILVMTGLLVLFGAVEWPLAIQMDALVSGLKFFWAILISFAGASLFFYTTKISELRESIEAIEERLFKTKHPYLRFSLLFSLTLGFIPRVFFEWSKAEEAWRGRGGKRSIRMMLSLIPPVMERLILSAKETAHALELRIGR